MSFQTALSSVACSVAEGMKPAPAVQHRPGHIDTRKAAVMAAAALFAALPLEISHLLLMLAGAAGYLLFVASQTALPRQRPCRVQVDKARPLTNAPKPRPWPRSVGPCKGKTAILGAKREGVERNDTETHGSLEPITPAPVAPTFQAVGLEAEAEELIEQLLPTANCDAVVSKLATVVHREIRHLFPSAEVLAFSSANLASGKAFGVAVPDVEVVVNVRPDTIFRNSPQQHRKSCAVMDSQKLHKHVLRKCTERLVATCGFKFRRSAFRGGEPKVTVLAPSALGLFNESFAVDISINAVTPLQSAALLIECGKLEPRARSLILFVRRWAKDRGICHAAKGHLPPYVWTLLVIYFLQVGVEEEGPLLPPVSEFQASSSLVPTAATDPGRASQRARPWRHDSAPKSSVGRLFKEFVRFYSTRFDWQNEAISVRLGRRTSPVPNFPFHRVGELNGPSIEDPFEVQRNLGVHTTAASLERLHEELSRAHSLCCAGDSLSILLEPWKPPLEDCQDGETEDFSASA